MRVPPNFWLSLDYLQAIRAEEVESGGWVWIEEPQEEKPVCLFPPIHRYHLLPSEPIPVDHIWSTMVLLMIPLLYQAPRSTSYFLDYNFMYLPSQFTDLSGKRWATFRKNTRKWSRRVVGKWTYVGADDTSLRQDWAEAVLLRWLEGRGENEEIEDLEPFWWYIFNSPNVRFLFRGSEAVGVNVWDETWWSINFRYSFADPQERFLSEFLRYRFFLDPGIQKKNKIVNDGGCLGNPELERFKRKLNPIWVNEIHSWRLRDGESQNAGTEGSPGGGEAGAQ
jgi:hypothetical protein